jgi:hypothetical protein
VFGLALCYVARVDPEWDRERLVSAKRGREDIELKLWGGLWVADLKNRAWVPVHNEDDRQRVTANATNLQSLLDHSWLENNEPGIRFLSKWFDFDELELRLLGLAPNQVHRRELRDGLARLVEIAGGEPKVYAALAAYVRAQQNRERDIGRCRRFGLAVQAAIQAVLELRGLTVKLVDRGFDFEVDLRAGDPLEDLGSRFELGPYLVEVKATTSGKPNLTPAQAMTASREHLRYVLCVVDLRGLSDAEIDEEWTAERVEPLARMVADIGGRVERTYDLIEAARIESVSIQNDGALRYQVPSEVCEEGITISHWVSSVFGRYIVLTGPTGNWGVSGEVPIIGES